MTYTTLQNIWNQLDSHYVEKNENPIMFNSFVQQLALRYNLDWESINSIVNAWATTVFDHPIPEYLLKKFKVELPPVVISKPLIQQSLF